MSIIVTTDEPVTTPTAPTFAEATRVWAKIGLLSFGGPAGQIALMHKELVEERRWIGEQRFLHALNYCMLLPGPEAQQLATYIGWLMHRTAGGLIAGLLFVLPGALVMLGLSILYAVYREVPLIDAVFFGVKAAVLAVVVEAVLRIGKRALKNRTMVAIAVAAFIGIYVFRVPFPLIILAAGVAGWIGSRQAPQLFTAGGHGSKGDTPDFKGVVDLMFERGELAHADPSWGRALPGAGDLAAGLAGAGAVALAVHRLRQRVDADRCLLQHHGGRHLRRRLCGAGLCGASRGGHASAGSRRGRWSMGWASPRPRPDR